MIFMIAHISVLISIGLLATGATKFWAKRKVHRYSIMMLGAWLQVAGAVCMEISPFFTPHIIADGSVPIVIPMNVFDILSRVFFAAGILSFSSGFAVVAFKQSTEKNGA